MIYNSKRRTPDSRFLLARDKGIITIIARSVHLPDHPRSETEARAAKQRPRRQLNEPVRGGCRVLDREEGTKSSAVVP